MSISRMHYVDDSGSEASGLIVYAWVEVAPDRWRYALRTILELRKQLYRDHSLPATTELHATKFVNGRGRIVPEVDAGTEDWKTLGRAIATTCLETLASSDDIRVGAAWRHTNDTRRAYAIARGDVYLELVRRWDAQHREAGTYALVGMDGDGSDASYMNAHRALPLDTRHIIEDPMMHDSKQSQWTQMADLVAYSVFTHLNRHDGNEFGWHWYDEYLRPKDVHGNPLEI